MLESSKFHQTLRRIHKSNLLHFVDLLHQQEQNHSNRSARTVSKRENEKGHLLPSLIYQMLLGHKQRSKRRAVRLSLFEIVQTRSPITRLKLHRTWDEIRTVAHKLILWANPESLSKSRECYSSQSKSIVWTPTTNGESHSNGLFCVMREGMSSLRLPCFSIHDCDEYWRLMSC